MFINPRHCSHSHRKTSFIQSPDRSHKQDGLILFHISCNSLRLPSLVGVSLVLYISFFFISFNFNSKYLKHLSQFFFIYYHSIAPNTIYAIISTLMVTPITDKSVTYRTISINLILIFHSSSSPLFIPNTYSIAAVMLNMIISSIYTYQARYERYYHMVWLCCL